MKLLSVPLLCFLFIIYWSSVDASRVSIRRISSDKTITRQVSPKEIYSMPYENFKINIYENSNNEGKSETPSRLKYYYAPIALLDQKSAVSIASYDGKNGELKFDIEMWNEKVEKNVLDYLRGFLGSDMKPHQVQMIPVEEVSLLISSTTLSKTHSVSSEWIPYNQFQKSITFSMSCSVKNDCDQLAKNMRSSPRQFEYLKITMSPTCWNTSLTMGINILETQVVPAPVPIVSLPNAISTEEWKQVTATMGNLKNQLTAATQAFIESQTTVADLKNKLAVTTAELESTKTNLATTNANLDTVTSSLNAASLSLMDSKTTVSNLKNELAETKSQLTARVVVTENTISDLNTQLSATSLSLADSKTIVTNLKNQLADSNADLLATKQNLAIVMSTLTATNAELFTTKNNLATTNSNLETVTSNLSATNDDLFTTKKNLATTNSNLASMTSTLAATNADFLSTKDKLQVTSANFDILMKYNLPERFTSMYGDYLITKENLATMTSNLTATNADLTATNNNLAAINSNIETVMSSLTGLQTTVNAPPISFYVQRTSSLSTQNAPIPFNVERLNVGGAMNLPSGIFKAPRAGIYFFSFSGIAGSNRGLLDTGLYLNGNLIASGTIAHGVPHPTFSIQSTLQLKANDEISVRIYGGNNVLYDDNRNFNHFTGFLIRTV